MVSEASALSPSPLEVPSEGTHHRKGRTLLRPGTESSNLSPSIGEFAANLTSVSFGIGDRSARFEFQPGGATRTSRRRSLSWVVRVEAAPVLRAHGETAPSRAAHAVRLAGDRPHHRDQPSPRRAWPALRGDQGQDASARRRRGALSWTPSQPRGSQRDANPTHRALASASWLWLPARPDRNFIWSAPTIARTISASQCSAISVPDGSRSATASCMRHRPRHRRSPEPKLADGHEHVQLRPEECGDVRC
jgi:hypothetical protein